MIPHHDAVNFYRLRKACDCSLVVRTSKIEPEGQLAFAFAKRASNEENHREAL